jgi:hypothetical protein
MSWTALEPPTASERADHVPLVTNSTTARACGIYEEPKKLVEHGLARAAGMSGGRSRTRYSVTPRGRREFRVWLAEPSAEPRFESEALVRALFADQGDKDLLLSTLAQLGLQAAAARESLVAQAEGYLAGESPFPEQLHLVMLVGQFMNEYVALLARWATWAEDEVASWPVVTDAAGVDNLRDKVQDLIRLHAASTGTRSTFTPALPQASRPPSGRRQHRHTAS